MYDKCSFVTDERCGKQFKSNKNMFMTDGARIYLLLMLFVLIVIQSNQIKATTVSYGWGTVTSTASPQEILYNHTDIEIQYVYGGKGGHYIGLDKNSIPYGLGKFCHNRNS
jgi:hypothetical protein